MAHAKKHTAEFMQPRDSFSGDHEGVPFVLTPTEVFAADHPLVRKYPNHFKPLTADRSRPDVEQATQAPGERRPVAL